MAHSDTRHIFQSLAVNLAVTVAKGVAAAITGSGAMLAETLHTFADCGNQLLLLLGLKQARKPADESHPLGYGRSLYFWSFMVALLLFLGGGMFSIYEGIHKTLHPEPVGDVTVGLVVLGVALVLEGWATCGNIAELNRRRGEIPFFRFLRRTKDSDLVVLFGENGAAVLGLLLALCFILIAKVTGNGEWDAIGSLSIGVVLVGVACFLAVEVKSLMIGEGADPALGGRIRQVAAQHPAIVEVLRVLTVQQGPGEVMVAMKLRFVPGLTTGGELCDVINQFEAALKTACPEIRWCFVEPDMKD